MFNMFAPCLSSKSYIEKHKKDLCLAIINNNTDKVRSLLALGVPVDFLVTPQMRNNIPTQDWGCIPLTHFAAILASSNTEILEAIIKAGGSIDQIYEVSEHITSGSILHNVLTFHSYMPTLSFLISTGANVNAQNSNGYTVLHLAAQSGHEQTKLLLDNGADINALDNDMNTVMHYAKDQFVFEILKANNAKIDQPNLKGVTPLLHATEAAKLVLIRKLINAGANIFTIDHCGRDIMDYASVNEHTLTFVQGKIALLYLIPHSINKNKMQINLV